MPDASEYYVGVDLGGTNIQVGVVGADAKVLSREKKKTRAEEGADAVIRRIAKAVDAVIEKAKLEEGQVAAVGVGAPGAIDPDTGVVLTAPNLRWTDQPLAEQLGQQLNRPIVVDNDVNVGAWGEYKAGVGAKSKARDLLAVFIGTGIGGGLVLNGELYHGHHQTAGEIGHTLLHADGALGRRTLENCASRTAVVNLLRELVLANHPSAISGITGGDLTAIRSKVLAQALQEGDELAIRVLKQAATYIGVSVANMVTMLSLPMVVLGGGLVEALGEPFVEWVRKSFVENVFPESLASCEVVAGALGDDAGIVGAALLAKEKKRCGKG